MFSKRGDIVPGFEIFGKEEKEQVLEVLDSGVLFPVRASTVLPAERE